MVFADTHFFLSLLNRHDVNHAGALALSNARRLGIDEVLTGDHHFEQAGFRILFPYSA